MWAQSDSAFQTVWKQPEVSTEPRASFCSGAPGCEAGFWKQMGGGVRVAAVHLPPHHPWLPATRGGAGAHLAPRESILQGSASAATLASPARWRGDSGLLYLPKLLYFSAQEPSGTTPLLLLIHFSLFCPGSPLLGDLVLLHFSPPSSVP